jgi:hypothetical protein
MVFLVGPEDLDVFWPEASWLLERAFEHTMGETDLKDIRLLIEAGVYKLVVVVPEDCDSLLAAFVVELCKYSLKTSLKVVFAGADPNTIDQWAEPVNAFLEEGARTLGADYLELVGRPGWERSVAKALGWKKHSVLLTRAL